MKNNTRTSENQQQKMLTNCLENRFEMRLYCLLQYKCVYNCMFSFPICYIYHWMKHNFQIFFFSNRMCMQKNCMRSKYNWAHKWDFPWNFFRKLFANYLVFMFYFMSHVSVFYNYCELQYKKEHRHVVIYEQKNSFKIKRTLKFNKL